MQGTERVEYLRSLREKLSQAESSFDFGYLKVHPGADSMKKICVVEFVFRTLRVGIRNNKHCSN